MIELPAERMRTRSEVAEILGVTSKTLRDWERAGRGPECVRFSPKVARYPAAAVARFVQSKGLGVPTAIEARQ